LHSPRDVNEPCALLALPPPDTPLVLPGYLKKGNGKASCSSACHQPSSEQHDARVLHFSRSVVCLANRKWENPRHALPCRIDRLSRSAKATVVIPDSPIANRSLGDLGQRERHQTTRQKQNTVKHKKNSQTSKGQLSRKTRYAFLDESHIVLGTHGHPQESKEFSQWHHS